jgi:hypothetical protein
VSSKTYDPRVGLPANFLHLVTSDSCDKCHTSANSNGFTTWLGAGYAHNPTTDKGNCQTSNCHGSGGPGKTIASYANHIQVGSIITSSMSCDSSGCHKIYDSNANVTTFAGGILPHSLFPSTQCKACHGVYTAFGTYGAVGKVTNHIPTDMSDAVSSITGVGDCNVCHKSTPPNVAATSGAAAWFSETVGVAEHGCAKGGGVCGVYCVTCHLTGTAILASKIQKFSHQSASQTKDCSRSGCHAPIGTKGKAFTKWN